jgi:small nuclear ribonucleoprotein (snRNP)-like protein
VKTTAIVVVDTLLELSNIGKPVTIRLEDGTEIPGVMSAVVSYQELTVEGTYTIQSGSINLTK